MPFSFPANTKNKFQKKGRKRRRKERKKRASGDEERSNKTGVLCSENTCVLFAKTIKHTSSKKQMHRDLKKLKITNFCVYTNKRLFQGFILRNSNFCYHDCGNITCYILAIFILMVTFFLLC